MKQPFQTGQEIRQLRKEKDLSQEDLAKKSGVSIQYIRMIEAGGHYEVGDKIKKQLADALDISVWALFPDVKMKVDLYRILLSRHGQALVIRDYQVPMFKEVLSRMSQDEFNELILSGSDSTYVHQKVKAWAKDHNIEVIE
jgi:transcriptional regulator with XRE-family HTH domain